MVSSFNYRSFYFLRFQELPKTLVRLLTPKESDAVVRVSPVVRTYNVYSKVYISQYAFV